MNLTTPRDYYKPFDYDWAFNYFETQQKMHWLPTEVPMHEDLRDWKMLTEAEKNLLTQIFRFFTQTDVDVASGYINYYLPLFKKPELRMLLLTIGSIEAIHVWAYAYLIDTLGLPEAEYKAFHEYREMREKHDYMLAEKPPEQVDDLLRTIARISIFGEGLQLFSSFAILLNFPRFGKMRGMGQIITWSVRDESLHVDAMIEVFHEIINESPWVWKQPLREEITSIAETMVDLEDQFIDLAFELGDIEGLTTEEMKRYIRYIADRRLLQIGLPPRFGVSDNPLPWLDEILNAVEHSNFFETRATEYAKGALTGSWADVWERYDELWESPHDEN